MRCIETLHRDMAYDALCLINRNMRCIETSCGSFSLLASAINRNMRCIETPEGTERGDHWFGLIET